jgi:hypothetical protein
LFALSQVWPARPSNNSGLNIKFSMEYLWNVSGEENEVLGHKPGPTYHKLSDTNRGSSWWEADH